MEERTLEPEKQEPKKQEHVKSNVEAYAIAGVVLTLSLLVAYAME